jgi:hypothetical protein
MSTTKLTCPDCGSKQLRLLGMVVTAHCAPTVYQLAPEDGLRDHNRVEVDFSSRCCRLPRESGNTVRVDIECTACQQGPASYSILTEHEGKRMEVFNQFDNA